MKFDPKNPQPGRYDDVPISMYHSSPGVSRSTLMALANGTPKACKHYMENPPKETPALAMGSAVDLLVFEPHLERDALAVRPKFGRSKAALEEAARWDEENAGKLILTEPQFDEATLIAAAVRSAKSVRGLMGNANAQLSFWWDQEGVLAKARPDGYDEATGTTFDLKTTRSLDPHDLARSMRNYGYDVQASMNALACKALGLPWTAHVIVWVEKAPPYDVRCDAIGLGSDWLLRGELLATRLLREFGRCLATNKWPGHAESIGTLPMPKWIANEIVELEVLEEQSRHQEDAA